MAWRVMERIGRMAPGNRLYLLATLGLLLMVFLPEPWKGVTGFPSVAAFTLGVAWHAQPWLKRAWSNPAGKVFVGTIHVLILLAAHIVATKVVAASLGLPPDKFGSTVHILSLILVFPVWSLFVGVLLSVISVAVFVKAMLFGPWKDTPEHGLVQMGHFMGLFCGAVLLLVMAEPANSWTTKPPGWVQDIAYMVDFHELPRLPGVKKDERVVVLDDDMLAVGEMKNGTLSVTLRSAKAAEE